MDGASSPRKCASSAAYAVPASKGDASTDIPIGRAPIAVPGIVTSFHDVPWLRETWMMPVMVVIQMTPGVTVDAAIDMRPTNDGTDVSRAAARVLVSAGAPGCGTVRSGLSFVQVAPPSVVATRY